MKTCSAPPGPGLKIQSTRQLWPTVNSSVSLLPVPCQTFVTTQAFAGSAGADSAARGGGAPRPVSLLSSVPATLSSTGYRTRPMRTTASFVLPFNALHRRASADPSPVRIEPSVRGRLAGVGRAALRFGPPERCVGPPEASVEPPASSIGAPE